VYRLSPPSAFGVPGDDYTTLPGGEGGVTQIMSPTIDQITGNRILRGTLSCYRDQGQGVNFADDLNDVRIAVRDDTVFIDVETEQEPDDVLFRLDEMVERLSLWLSHHLNAVVTPTLVQYVNRTTRKRIPTARYSSLMRVRYYHVPTIEEGIATWCRRPQDDKVDAAMRYYRLGMFLENEGMEHADDFRVQLLTEAILNYFKSVSALLGDPSVDPDYQSRYRSLGLSREFFYGEVEWLRRDIRNNGGVAHYSLQTASVNDLLAWASRARGIARQVIAAAKTTRPL